MKRRLRSFGSGRCATYDYDSLLHAARPRQDRRALRSHALDANGSVEGLECTDATLPPSELYSYDPYGRLASASRQFDDPPNKAENELATPELRDNPFRFQGFYYDAGTQTYDMQARDYRPDIARFLSQDRFADAYRDLALLADPTSQNRCRVHATQQRRDRQPGALKPLSLLPEAVA